MREENHSLFEKEERSLKHYFLVSIHSLPSPWQGWWAVVWNGNMSLVSIFNACIITHKGMWWQPWTFMWRVEPVDVENNMAPRVLFNNYKTVKNGIIQITKVWIQHKCIKLMYELTVCYAIYNMYVYYLQNVWKCKKP